MITVFLSGRPRPRAADPRRDRGRHRDRGVRSPARVQMTQMPQLVALFNGVGGGAAALVALLELGAQRRPAGWLALARRRSRSWSARCPSPARCVTFAKLQELMTTRPVVFPGLQCGHAAGRRGRGRRRRRRRGHRVDRLGGARCWCSAWPLGVLLVLPVGGADVPIVISLLNAFTGLDRRRRRLRARQRAAAGGRHAGRRQRHLPHPADGHGHGPLGRRHPVRRPQGRLDGRLAAQASDRPVRSASAEDVAILLAYAERVDHRARLRPGRRPGASTPCASSPTCSRRAASRSTTPSTRSPAGCPGT